MVQSTSRIISSNQKGIHPDLLTNLVTHLDSEFCKPIAEHSQRAFDFCQEKILQNEMPIIMDSGCGIGQSTQLLAKQFPDHWVLGVDQSAHRLAKQENKKQPSNCLFVRADVVDFWRLAMDQRWRLAKHFVLYPNPWPKKQHLMRRWHGHPIFPTMLNLSNEIEIRTNWDIYILEFATALDHLNYAASDITVIEPEQFFTPFEEKYHRSGQKLYRMTAILT